MNLQPSKLSLAANQVWNESTSLFSKKKDVQIGKKNFYEMFNK